MLNNRALLRIMGVDCRAKLPRLVLWLESILEVLGRGAHPKPSRIISAMRSAETSPLK
jgi:hypothetical protein